MPNDCTHFPQAGNEFGRLVLAVLNSGTGVWDRDVASGRIVYSREWKAMLGYEDHEISDLIEDSYTRVHPEDLHHVRTAIQAHFDCVTSSYVVEHRLRCKDGSFKWVLSRGRVVSRDSDGRPLRMTGVTTDISCTVALSEKLRANAELLTHLTDEVPGLVYQYHQSPDGVGSFTYASAGIASIFGLTPEQLTSDARAVEAMIHPDDIDTFKGSLAVSAETLDRWYLEFRVILPGIGERWREAHAKPRRLPDGGTLWHGFVSDISAHKQLEQQLHDAAATDFLTGMPNRRHIMLRMEQELARIQREPTALSAVLMFDLDLFKEINDRHGHAMGDEVLKHFSSILQHELRKVDCVGRIGGEEFAIVLSGADIDDAERFAQRVRDRLAESPMRDGELCIPVTVSIGISAMLPEDRSIAASLSRADTALYRAKQDGRNRVMIAA